MFEQETDDELEIPEQDAKIISDYARFVEAQLTHQYKLGILRGMKLAHEQITKEKAKYGR